MITIITHSDKRPDFIKIQYDSMRKHLKCDFEFIVLNNDVTKSDNYYRIHHICNQNSIKCIDITLDEDLRHTNNNENYNNGKFVNGNRACVYSLIWTFNKYLSDEEYVCIMDSDMFFISDINLEEKIRKRKIIFTPHHRPGVRYIWPGFVCLNIKDFKYLKDLNWNQGLGSGESLVNGIVTDVGGHTHYDIIKYELDSNSDYVYEYSLYDDIKYNGLNSIYHLQVNGCVNYSLELINNNLLKYEHIAGWKVCDNKSFTQEQDFDNYGENLLNKLNKILLLLRENDVNLPSPVRISFLELDEEFFMLHYQCGSNYADFCTLEYNKIKTNEILKILNK